jgi:signal transduction histidine kinase/ligand-binding sensor domain-containing protein
MSFPLSYLQVQRKCRYLLFASFLAFIFVVNSNRAADTTRQSDYFLRSWNADKGLPDNSVMSVIQTRDGYLWLATFAGLARFDGVRFTVFNSAKTPGLKSDRFSSLYEDAEGNMWIGHEHGEISRYHDGKFETFAASKTGARRKITAINADETGAVWMLNEEGSLVRIRDGAICALPNTNGVATLARDTEGRLWVASDGRLAELREGRLLPLGATNGFTDDYVQGICASRTGGMWVATAGSIRQWQAGAWSHDLGTNPCGNMFTAMMELKSGDVALGTVESGLFLLTPDKKALHFGRDENFPHVWIRSLCEDREGTLWVGAGNAGIVALRAGQVETFQPPDHWQGRGGAQSVAIAHDGAVWVTTEGAGLYRFFDGQWQHFGKTNGLSNLFVWCVSEDAQHRIWAGTWGGGMYVLKDGRFVTPPGLENVTAPMPAILHASNGVTWIGTADGLLRYQDGAVKFFGENAGLKLPDVRAIVESPDGTIWFGMAGGGLGRLQVGKVSQFFKTDGLPNDYVQCLHLDGDGTLWIGTYSGGIGRLRDGHFARIAGIEGLPSSIISAIEEDAQGNFWISSRGGLFLVAKKSLTDCADGKISTITYRTFGLGDGMPTLECSGGFQPAAARGSDGRLWFPTTKGLVAVNPATVSAARWPVPVRLEEVSVHDHSLALPPTNAAPVKIAPGEQGLKFRYTGLSFIAPATIQFQRRLDGWEQDWVDAGNQRVAEYSYLPPGDYLFHVRACNGDGVWDEAGATLAFVVLPHFWQTWWFRLLAALTVIALVAGSVWFISRRRMRLKLERIERQQTLERERTRIAKDIHDHLGANLTRISLLSQSAYSELKNPEQAAAQLDRIYDTARELTRSMDEIVWAVNPQHDTLDSLASYLGNFAQEYLGPLHIRCRLDLPLHLPHWPITAEMRHNVFLAFKEALHNVVKHSTAQEVSVSLATDDTGFYLAVRDNGQGFDPATVPARPRRGNGLDNMRQRLEKIGGSCEIQSAPGSGTEIKFRVSVPASARQAT